MNENIDLVKILKDCPKGTKLYSPIFGEVDFIEIRGKEYPINTKSGVYNPNFTKSGLYYADKDGECLLFPSKDQRDWGKFTAPWYKKERFDPKTLQPFDKVLSKFDGGRWSANLFSHIYEEDNEYYSTCSFVCNGSLVKFCIPYNEETKHLVGTTDEAPEFYRYWEE